MSSAWIQTFSGVAFPLFEPKPSDVRIADIAHSLSMQCRYNGHIKRFYSVAEHCWLLSHMVSVEAALPALLHDAPEAYIGDMVSPLKREMKAYAALDKAMLDFIYDCYKVKRTDPIMEEVHAGDTWIAYQEARALMVHPELVDKWPAPPEFKPKMYFDFSEVGLSPERARALFLARFADLIHLQAGA